MSYFNDGKALVISNLGTTRIIEHNGMALSTNNDLNEIILDVGSEHSSGFHITKIFNKYIGKRPIYKPETIFCFQQLPNASQPREKSYSNYIGEKTDFIISKIKKAQSTIFVTQDEQKIIAPQKNVNTFANKYINKKTTSQLIETDIKVTEGISISSKSVKAVFEEVLPSIKAITTFRDNVVVMSTLELYVVRDFRQNSLIEASSKLEPMTAIVEDYKPPSFGNVGSGSGMKFARFVVQKNSFAQINLEFTDSKVIDALGLPQGMLFKAPFLTGAPTVSGVYPLRLKLDNGFTLDILLVVPNLPRKK